MRKLIGFGIGLVIAIFLALYALYLIIAMVIVSGLSFLAYLTSDGWIVLVLAGIAAIITAVYLVRTGRIHRIARKPLPLVVPSTKSDPSGRGHHVP